MADPSPVSFAEKVYALSKVIHVVKYHNDIASSYNAHQRMRLRLLDDIALLLVTESSSDVAAVSFQRHQAGVVFWYSKNRPSTVDECEHIKTLIKCLKAENSTVDDRLRAMLAESFKICGPKIRSRLAKLKSALSVIPVNDWHVQEDPQGSLHRYFEDRLEDWYGEGSGPISFLRGFLSDLHSLKVKESEPDQILLLIELAHITGSFKPLKALFPDAEVGKRMRLLGDYFGAVTRIVECYDSIRPNSTVPVEISFKEVLPPQPDKLSFPADFLLILNQFANEKRLPMVDYDSLTKAYPPQSPFDVDNKSWLRVKHSVHAECTLAVYLHSLDRNWEHIEIGCSKGSCWLCEMYLTGYSPALKFHVSHVHGKLQPGWQIPAHGNQVSTKRILDLVNDEVLEVLYRTHNNTKTDEKPRSGSDTGKKEVNVKRAAKPAWFKP